MQCPHCEKSISDKNLETARRLDHCPLCNFSWSDDTIATLPESFRPKLLELSLIEPTYKECPYINLNTEQPIKIHLKPHHPPVWRKFLDQLNSLTDDVLIAQASLVYYEEHPPADFETRRRVERAKAERNAIMAYQIVSHYIIRLGSEEALTPDEVKVRILNEKIKIRKWFTRMNEHYHQPPIVSFPTKAFM